MPLQNRVDPFGNLIRTPARGTMMGNRGGALHNADQEIVRSYKSRRWITCVLEFRGRHREVMSRYRYTELFFIDEAVAFAAGHRPCAECRRERYNAFRDAWARAKQQNDRPAADEMDLELHPARIDKRKKVTYETPLRLLPDGCFVQIVGDAYLVLGDALLLWTPGGYARREARPQLFERDISRRFTSRCAFHRAIGRGALRPRASPSARRRSRRRTAGGGRRNGPPWSGLRDARYDSPTRQSADSARW
ncbi:MAG: hypothetical protein ABSG56_27640 [Bryobacteraceae bacterium]